MTRVRKSPAQRRAEILDQAIRSIGSLGFNGMSIGQLAQSCSISKAGLLYYFESKEELLLAVLDEIERRELVAIGPLLPTASTLQAQLAPANALADLMKMIIERFVEQPEPSRFVTVLQAEALDPDHPAYSWFGAREKTAIDIFSRLLQGIHDEPESAARQLLALMHGLAQQWLRSPSTFPFVREWEKAIAAVLSSGVVTTRKLQASGAIAGFASAELMDRRPRDRF